MFEAFYLSLFQVKSKSCSLWNINCFFKKNTTQNFAVCDVTLNFNWKSLLTYFEVKVVSLALAFFLRHSLFVSRKLDVIRYCLSSHILNPYFLSVLFPVKISVRNTVLLPGRRYPPDAVTRTLIPDINSCRTKIPTGRRFSRTNSFHVTRNSSAQVHSFQQINVCTIFFLWRLKTRPRKISSELFRCFTVFPPTS